MDCEVLAGPRCLLLATQKDFESASVGSSTFTECWYGTILERLSEAGKWNNHEADGHIQDIIRALSMFLGGITLSPEVTCNAGVPSFGQSTMIDTSITTMLLQPKVQWLELLGIMPVLSPRTLVPAGEQREG